MQGIATGAQRREAQPRQPTSVWVALVKGLRGHPLHPPLTDLTIGMFVLAAVLAVIGFAGGIEEPAGKACWLALIGGLGAAVPTALTGFADWLTLEWGSPPWRTATIHLLAMVTAVTLFAFAAWQQWPGYRHGDVTTAGLVLSLAGAVALLTGGWFGGAIVFVHGIRVEAPAHAPSDVRVGEPAHTPSEVAAPGGPLQTRDPEAMT